MPRTQASMMHPRLEDLFDKVDSRFTLVTLAAKRGRQINSYFNQLGEGIGSIVPPQVSSVSRKPLSIALEEVAEKKITYTKIEDEKEKEPVDILQIAESSIVIDPDS